MAGRLAGQVAIVTGAARGIGAKCAELFVREGAKVALWDLNETQGQLVANQLAGGASGGPAALFVRCDVINSQDITQALERTQAAFGNPTVLVNNAGIAVVGDVEEISEADWDRQFAINVKSVYLVSRQVIPCLRAAGGGSIINMASESAFVGFPMHPAYCSSKAAVVHLTRCMATRYASENIRVNALCPGTINTEMYQGFLAQQRDPEAVNADIKRMHPLGIGQPEDIAWAAVYLASNESRYTTGAPMLVEGGITAL